MSLRTRAAKVTRVILDDDQEVGLIPFFFFFFFLFLFFFFLFFFFVLFISFSRWPSNLDVSSLSLYVNTCVRVHARSCVSATIQSEHDVPSKRFHLDDSDDVAKPKFKVLPDSEDDSEDDLPPNAHDMGDIDAEMDNPAMEVEEQDDPQDDRQDPAESTLEGKLHSPGLNRGYVAQGSPDCPYKNFTEAMFSILYEKHRFTKALYTDLLLILQHAEFEVSDLFGSYDTLSRTRSCLPLVPYREYKVSFSSTSFLSHLVLD